MPEYATPTNVTFPLLDPGFVWRVSAFLLTAIALFGVIALAVGAGDVLSFSKMGIVFTWPHTVLHIVLAIAAYIFGFSSLPGGVVKVFALVFGLVYAALGVVGFFMFQATEGDTLLALTLGVNIVHIVLGLLYIVSGLAAKYS